MSTVVSKPGRSITPPALTRMFRLWGSSLGQKIIMAMTGVMLSGFVLGHMAGNLQVFQGPEAIDEYSQVPPPRARLALDGPDRAAGGRSACTSGPTWR